MNDVSDQASSYFEGSLHFLRDQEDIRLVRGLVVHESLKEDRRMAASLSKSEVEALTQIPYYSNQLAQAGVIQPETSTPKKVPVSSATTTPAQVTPISMGKANPVLLACGVALVITGDVVKAAGEGIRWIGFKFLEKARRR